MVPDRGGHGRQAQADPGEDAAVGAGAVPFQRQPALEVPNIASTNRRIRDRLRSAGVEAGSEPPRRADRVDAQLCGMYGNRCRW